MSDYRDRVYARYRAAGAAGATASAGGLAFLDQVVARHFPPARTAAILELGCGAGYLVRAARAAGYSNVSGIDASPEQVAEAARLGIAGVALGDARAKLAQAPAASFDMIVAFDVLEHMTKDEGFILADAVCRALKPGGSWILHTANAESPFFGRVRYGDITHEQAFTQDSLDQLLTLAGFAQVRSFEDRPAVHGVASALRLLAWACVRALLIVYLVAESGPAARRAILSQNLLCVAIK
jgi:cyclopropane fatty-acyl-phospholipid synthase-like methyltransferase